MYAIVEIAGQQFKVEEGKKVYVNRLANEAESTAKFESVMLVDNNGDIKIGTPYVSGASVEAKVIKHLKDDKIIVFKKKRRKGYAVKNGHRQCLTQILIEKVNL